MRANSMMIGLAARKVTALSLASLIALTAATTAEGAGCIWPNTSSTGGGCNPSAQLNGGVSTGWKYTGTQNQAIVFNDSGGSRNLELWFANSNTVLKKLLGPVDAHWYNWGSSPSGTTRNLIYNKGAYWALTSARSYNQ